MSTRTPAPATPAAACERCAKPQAVCICDRVQPVATRLRVLILQHPREDDALLGTARLVTLTLPAATIKVGLSWASLDHALGTSGADRDRWAVLAAARLSPAMQAAASGPVSVIERTGKARSTERHELDGFIVLDGTWSQAKTLWWRNPWLLKLPRIVLTPREPSMYGRMRREPRAEWVSTLEAVAEVLPALGEPPAARDSLRRLLRTLLQRVRDTKGRLK